MVVLGRRTQAPKPLSRSQIVDDDSDSASDSEYGDVSCEECGSGDSPAELLLCDGCNCNRGYHLFCLRPILVHVPKGKWFGPCCSKNKKPKYNRKRRRRASSLVMSKKKRRLLPFSPTEDHTRRMQQMASLATALTATGTKFSNELTYRPRMAPRSANCAALEQGGMQVCCKQ